MKDFPKKIVVIDDDETSNYLSEIIIHLVDESIEVITLTNGQNAINYFTETEEAPDLVILDINMPLVNGFEFLEFFSSQEWDKQTKFAIYSTSTRGSDIKKSMAYEHVIDYIEKPLNEDKLKSLFGILKIATKPNKV